MRIRRRPVDALRRAQEDLVSSAHSCSAAAPPSPAPCPETVAARRLGPPTGEVDRTTRAAADLDARCVSSGQNPQKEGQEKGDGALRDEKISGEDDGRVDLDHERPVNDVARRHRTPATVPKREEEDRSTELGTTEKIESGDSGQDMEHGEEKKTTEAAAFCKRGDGKGWHCKRAAKCGYSLCQHHLEKLRSYACYSKKKQQQQQKTKRSKKKKKKKPMNTSAVVDNSTPAGVHHRQEAFQKESNSQKRKRAEGGDGALGCGLDMSSDSFYYYSGFGPRWGKRRGGRRSVAGVGVPEGGDPDQVQVHWDDGAGDGTAAAVAGSEEDDGHDCEDPSRDGKPLKSRALSSLL